MRKLIDADGENQAVRSFLMFYTENKTVGSMRKNMAQLALAVNNPIVKLGA
jgi:hypothetical protein